MDAAGAVDAQNAPTAPWKTAQTAVSHSAHTHHRFGLEEKKNEDRQPALHTKFRTLPRFVRQVVTVPITYKGSRLRSSYRVDLIVEDKVVVEVKSVESVAPVCKAQVLTYMRVTGKTAGLLINFNMPKLMDGVKRLINPTYKL